MAEPAKMQSTPPSPAPARPDDARSFGFPLPSAWPSQPHGTYNGLNVGAEPPQGSSDNIDSPKPR